MRKINRKTRTATTYRQEREKKGSETAVTAVVDVNVVTAVLIVFHLLCLVRLWSHLHSSVAA